MNKFLNAGLVIFLIVGAAMGLAAISRKTKNNKQKENRVQFKVPPRVRMAYYFAPIHWFNEFLLLVTVIGLGIIAYILIQNRFPDTIKIFEDPGFTALFGVLLGSVLASYLSLRLQMQQHRLELSVAKKQDIYEPLYNALIEFQEDLEEFPYSSNIRTDSKVAQTMNTPKFIEWNDVRRDSRYVQTPKWIKSIFDQYSDDIEKYLQDRENVDVITQEKTREFLLEEYEITYRKIPGVDSMMTKDFLHGSPVTNNMDWEKMIDIPMILISNEDDKHKIKMRIIKASNELDEVQSVYSFYQEKILDNTSWLINELARIIQFINAKYETPGGLP